MGKKTMSILRYVLLFSIIMILMTVNVFGATSRQNPAKIGEKQTVIYKNYKGELQYKIEITMTDLICGGEALNILLDKDEYLITGISKSGGLKDRKWNDDEEFILAKFRIKVLETKNNDSKLFTTVSFNFVGKDNVFYDRVWKTDKPRNMDTFLYKDVYPGGEVEGWISFLVKKDDNKVVTVFDKEKSSEAWFDLRASTKEHSNNIKNNEPKNNINNETTIFNEIKVFIDEKQIFFDQPPIIESGRTLVPMRAIFEALGADITWDNLTRTVNSIKDNISIKVQIGKNIALVNGKEVIIDVPAKIINNRTLVPLRFVGESFGSEVIWDGNTRTVKINTNMNRPNITYNTRGRCFCVVYFITQCL